MYMHVHMSTYNTHKQTRHTSLTEHISCVCVHRNKASAELDSELVYAATLEDRLHVHDAAHPHLSEEHCAKHFCLLLDTT